MKMLRGERKQILSLEDGKFCNVAAIGAAAAIGGAAISANASRSAASTQADAANNASQVQRDMYNQTATNVRPWLNAGTLALNSLVSGVLPAGTPMTGFSTPSASTTPASGNSAAMSGAPSGSSGPNQNWAAFINMDPAYANSLAGGAGGGFTVDANGNLVNSSGQPSPGANAATSPSAGGSAAQTPMATGALNPQAYGAAPGLSGYGNAPSMSGVAGAPSFNTYGSVGQMQNAPAAATLKAYQDYVAQNPYQSMGAWDASKFHEDPGYQFQLQQGLDALTNRASIAGGMNSNNMKGLIGYAEGMANTDYQQAFQNYQTEAGRSLGEYQAGLQDYMQQFQMGQNTNSLNNQVLQQNYQNQLTNANFDNSVTQQQYLDQMSTTAANNQNIQQSFADNLQSQAFNNAAQLQNWQNANTTTGLNNSVAQQNFQNANTVTGLNNQNIQQEFSNLSSLSQSGMGAALQQGQIGTSAGANIANTIVGAGNANAAGTVGVANAVTGALGSGYNQWLMGQFMNNSTPSYSGFALDTSGPFGNFGDNPFQMFQP